MELRKIEGAIEAILFTMGEAVEAEKIFLLQAYTAFLWPVR